MKLYELTPQKESRVFVKHRGIPKKYFILTKKKREMEPISKDQSIVKQSCLKSAVEIANLLDYKPQSLAEFLRFNDLLVEYCIFGTQTDVKNDIKRFDDHIKKSRPIESEIGFKK